jgi:hypothetical protein
MAPLPAPFRPVRPIIIAARAEASSLALPRLVGLEFLFYLFSIFKGGSFFFVLPRVIRLFDYIAFGFFIDRGL